MYGVTISGGSGLNSNDLVKEVRYPDPSTGASSSSSKDVLTVNALGQALTMTDRNGTVHSYSYDVVGRQAADAITTLGSGVNGTVRRLTTAYARRAILICSLLTMPALAAASSTRSSGTSTTWVN